LKAALVIKDKDGVRLGTSSYNVSVASTNATTSKDVVITFLPRTAAYEGEYTITLTDNVVLKDVAANNAKDIAKISTEVLNVVSSGYAATKAAEVAIAQDAVTAAQADKTTKDGALTTAQTDKTRADQAVATAQSDKADADQAVLDAQDAKTAADAAADPTDTTLAAAAATLPNALSFTSINVQ
jgi:hypothetical protein